MALLPGLRPRIGARALAALAGASLACALAAPTASALVRPELGSAGVGLQTREVAGYWFGTGELNGQGKNEGFANAAVKSFGNPADNAVVHADNLYAIYWDPGDYYHGDWQSVIDGFFAHLGEEAGGLNTVFAVDSQYYGTNGTKSEHAANAAKFRGAYVDTNPYPAAGCTNPRSISLEPLLEDSPRLCLTDSQLRSQLLTFIAQHSLPKGMSTVYHVMTPPGVTLCLEGASLEGSDESRCSDFKGTLAEVEKDESEGGIKLETETYKSYVHSFCSYHAAINPDAAQNGDGNTVLYAAIPWIAGEEGYNGSVKGAESTDYACQDGGFEPGSKPGGELELKEKTHVRNAQEQEEFEKKTKQEQREQEEAETLGLGNPHQEEPNQLGALRGPDGLFDHGLADLIISQIGVEQQNIVTDPLLNGWQQQEGSRLEASDECRNSFYPTGGSAVANPATRAGTVSNQVLGGARYLINDAFNLASLELSYPGVPCQNGVDLMPAFTAPSPVNAGELVGFDGMESDITLNWAGLGLTSPPSGHFARYTWSFGDGTPDVSGVAPGSPSGSSPASSPCEAPWQAPCAAAVFHSFAYRGTYEVTLTVEDVGGDTASVTQPVEVVNGPSPPAPGASSGSGSAPSSGSTGGEGAKRGPTYPAPTARAAAASGSLRAALRHGLTVRYQVNEQVAGVAEALISAKLAHRLHIHGRRATGLPAGYPRSVVIGRAVLVTRKGGAGAVRLRFSKSTAKALRKLREVTITLRLVVRNAEQSNPKTTTLISKIVLKSGHGSSGHHSRQRRRG